MKILNLGYIEVTLDFRTLQIGLFMLHQFTLRCCKHQSLFPPMFQFSKPSVTAAQSITAFCPLWPKCCCTIFLSLKLGSSVLLSLTIQHQVLPPWPSVWHCRALAPTAPGAGPAPPPDNNTTTVFCSLLHYAACNTTAKCTLLYYAVLYCSVLHYTVMNTETYSKPLS